MAAAIKAIVFKTAQLSATKYFFETILQMAIKETSAQHFVVHSKGTRLVFLESGKGFEIELYINEASNKPSNEIQFDSPSAAFENCKDPNGISIITFYKKGSKIATHLKK